MIDSVHQTRDGSKRSAVCYPRTGRLPSLSLCWSLCNRRAQQFLRWATMPEQSGPKSGGCYAPSACWELGLRLMQCCLGQGLHPYEVVSWSI